MLPFEIHANSISIAAYAVEGPLTIDNETSITDENMRKRFEPSILMVGH